MHQHSPVLCLTFALIAAGAAHGAEHPIVPLSVSADQLESLRSRVQPLLDLSPEEMLEIIPEQSGLYFVGCPNCDEGRQEGQFGGGGQHQPWSPLSPLEMRCSYCGHVYPSEQYPMEGVLEVTDPAGNVDRYPYWEDADGYRHYFGARIDYHRIRYMESAANTLARLYLITGDDDYARRSAMIIHRFAEVFPGYCYHFDFPFRQKEIYEGDVAPEDFRGGYRTSRWTWWAYQDVPSLLIEAWDQLASSEAIAAMDQEMQGRLSVQIEDFLHAAIAPVIANQDDLHNMSPGMWRDFIHAGRALETPEYVHIAIDRLERLMTRRFFADGSWQEGAPSYHSQVVGGLAQVFTAAAGYSDPPGYLHPETGRRFDDLDIPDSFPIVASARTWLDTMRLPNGRFVPVHDTWSTNRRSARETSEAFLLPALGHGCLARGEGDGQFQAHMTWSPGQGHQHYDGLSLILFANGRELLSDIGYTHTMGRAWSLVSAAHNTVVIDHENQTANTTTFGSLRYFDASDPACQLLSVDNPAVYPDRATIFRRTLASVAVDDATTYLIDRFQVDGGETHDYFLHGSSDEPQTLTLLPFAGEAAPALQPCETLLPEGVEFTPSQNEGDLGNVATRGWAYGYLQDVAGTQVGESGLITAEYQMEDGAPALRAHMLAEPGDELFTGRNLSIRGARENDTGLADHTRPFALLRRSGGQSAFVSVIEPVGDAPRIESVRVLPLEGAATALEITLEGRRDLVLFDADGLQATWLERDLSADAELVVLRVPDDGAPSATVVGGEVSFGDLQLRADSQGERTLLEVDAPARTMRVAGELSVAPGTVVMLDHAGERRSAFTVASAATEADSTLLTLTDDPGFTWDLVTSTSSFTFLPHATYTGQHTVSAPAVAHLPRASR